MRWLVEDKELCHSVQSIIDRKLVDGADAQALEEVVARMNRDIDRNERFREMIQKKWVNTSGGEIVCKEG